MNGKRSPRSDKPRPAPLSRRYSVPKILHTRNLLAAILRSEYGHGDRVIPRDDFERFTQIVAETLGGTIDQDALHKSLLLVAGIPLSDAMIFELAHRLAGNIPRLRAGEMVSAWTVQRREEWVPIQVTRVARVLNRRETERGADLTLKILAGTPCPRAILVWWSLRRCGFLSRELGFSGYRGKDRNRYRYAAPEQLVNLRFDGLVDPELSQNEPAISRIRCTEAHLRWNRELIRLRFRIDPGYTCPQGLPQDFPCHLCPFGFLTCPAGTHRQDYVQRPCSQCGRAQAFFDPDSAAAICHDCVRGEQRPRRRQ